MLMFPSSVKSVLEQAVDFAEQHKLTVSLNPSIHSHELVSPT